MKPFIAERLGVEAGEKFKYKNLYGDVYEAYVADDGVLHRYEGGECTCHTSMPPCDFCAEHVTCEICGRQTCKEHEKTGLCEECHQVIDALTREYLDELAIFLLRRRDEQMNISAESMKNALGVIAEAGLLIYRSAIGAGATPTEARDIVQAYCAATISSGKDNMQKDTDK